MTEKHFLVRKFFYTIATQARKQFEQGKREAESWLKGLLAPLKMQIADHKAQLDQRSEALMKVHKDMDALQKNMADVEAQHTALKNESTQLDQLLLMLMKAAQVNLSTSPQPSTKNDTANGPSLGVAPLIES